jgi:hypothetical protein
MKGREKGANGRSSRLVGKTRGVQHNCRAAELPAALKPPEHAAYAVHCKPAVSGPGEAACPCLLHKRISR